MVYKLLGWNLEASLVPIINATFKLTTLSSFLTAIRDEDLDYLKLLVNKLQIDLKQKDENGITLLHRVVSENLNYYPPHRQFSALDELFDCIADGKYTELKLLLQNKPVDLNALYKDQKTPLQWAVTNRQCRDIWARINIIKLLLNHGAYPNLGKYPLLSACYQNHKKLATPIIEVLCIYGANPSLSFHDGLTVLSEVALDGNEPLVRLLLSFGANPHAKEWYQRSLYARITNSMFLDSNGITVSIRRLLTKIEEPKDNKSIDLGKIIAFLKESGLDMNVKDFQGNTPLHRADSASALESLIENGADVNVTNLNLETPLHRAIAKNFSSFTLDKLLQKGADINAQDINRFTPFRQAMYLKGYSSTPEFLLEHQADVTIADKQGVTPLIAAITEKKSDIVNQLVSKRINVNEYFAPNECYPIHVALDPKNYNFTIMKSMVDADASLMAENAAGKNAFDVVKENMGSYGAYEWKSIFYRYLSPVERNGCTDYGCYVKKLDMPHLQHVSERYEMPRLLQYRASFIANSLKLKDSDILREIGAEILGQLLMQIIAKNLVKEFKYLLEIELIKDDLRLWQLLLDEKRPQLQQLFIAHIKDKKMLHDMLRLAVIDTEVEVVSGLLQDSVLASMINDTDEQGKTLLHEAILTIGVHLKEISVRFDTENYKYHRPENPIKKPGKIGIQHTAKTIEILVMHGANANLLYLGKSPLYHAVDASRFFTLDVLTDIVSTLLNANADVKPVMNLLYRWETSQHIKQRFCLLFIQRKQWNELFSLICHKEFHFSVQESALRLIDIENFIGVIQLLPSLNQKLTELLNDLYEQFDKRAREQLIKQTIEGNFQDVEEFPCREKLKAIKQSDNWASLFKPKVCDVLLLDGEKYQLTN